LRPIGVSDLDDLVALGSDPRVTTFVTRLARSAEERITLAEREWSERGYGMLASWSVTASASWGPGGPQVLAAV
jgi:hypothetical protein